MKEISKINIAGDERTIGAEGEITKINVNGKEYTLAGSGTKVVTELPEVGEEHTVYELRENKPASYDWVAHTPFQLGNDGFTIGIVSTDTFIFDTYEQMTSAFENITQPHEPLRYCLAYIRTEDKLYTIRPNGESWDFRESVKYSAYTFARPDSEIGNIYVLKSYEGYDVATKKYYGTLYNDTRVELNGGQDVCFILTQVTDYGQMDYGLLLSEYTLHPVTQLPTAQEAVNSYLDELIANGGGIVVEIDGVAKYNISDNGNYHWVNNPEIGAPNFYTGHKEPVVYTGPLQWEDVPNSIFDTIPYQEIIDEETPRWIFHPWKGGDKISYWIYSNDEWVNMDDVGKPVNEGTIYLTADSYADLKEMKFYLDGQELEVEWFDRLHYGILKGIPTNEIVTITLNGWAVNVHYNNNDIRENPDNAIEVTGAGCLSFNFIQS